MTDWLIINHSTLEDVIDWMIDDYFTLHDVVAIFLNVGDSLMTLIG